MNTKPKTVQEARALIAAKRAARNAPNTAKVLALLRQVAR